MAFGGIKNNSYNNFCNISSNRADFDWNIHNLHCIFPQEYVLILFFLKKEKLKEIN